MSAKTTNERPATNDDMLHGSTVRRAPLTIQDAKQVGFVSIVVAALFMIIISLITIGFTRLMAREQRQAVDRQLSRVALYAAESGVNDVITAIGNNTPGYNDPSGTKTSCDPSGLTNGGDLSGDGTVVITCALFDDAPGELQYDGVQPGSSKIVMLENAATGNNFETIDLSWGHPDPGGNTNFTCSDHPAALGTDSTPVLRVDLTAISNPNNVSRANLINKTDYMFFTPCSGGTNTHTFDSGSRGDYVEVQCSTAGNTSCNISIDVDSENVEQFFMRISPLYEPANIQVAGTDSSGPVGFSGAQRGIDVTARANDVVRRIRASVPFSGGGDVPEAALQVFDGICKLLYIDQVDTTRTHDECVGGPPLPPVACGDSGTFSIAAYAATFAGEPFADSVQTKIMDVLYNPSDPDGAGGVTVPGSGHSPIGLPHVPLDALNLTLAPSGCDYSIDYTAFCAFVDPDGPDAGLPPTDCFVGPNEQPAEAARLEFYGGYTGSGLTLECDVASGLMAYIDTEDLSDTNGDGMWDQSGWNGTLPLVRTGPSGTVGCMRIVHMCVANPAVYPSCGSPIAFTSVHMEEIDWNASPSP